MVLSFGSTPDFPAGEIIPSQSISGDFNGDSNLDLIVSSTSSASSIQPSAFAILLGNGTAGVDAFGAPRSVIVDQQGGNIQALATGDFNRDGKLDLLTGQAQYSPSFSPPENNSGSIAVLLGDGTGNFAAPVLINANAIQDLTVADFNSDGILDVAVVKGGTVSILSGDGTGAFQEASPVLIRGAYQTAIGAGDFNRDGKTDFVVVGSETSNSVATVFLNNGTGGFSASASTTGTFFNYSDGLAVVDFNQDGQLDVVTNRGVLLGDGTGNLRVASQFSATGTPYDYSGVGNPVIADFNGDGKLDVAQNDYDYSNNGFVSLGDGSGGVSQGTVVGRSVSSGGDFNKDGKLDLVSLNDTSVSLLVNNTTGTDALVFSSNNAYGNKPPNVVDASSQTVGTLSVNLEQKKLRLKGETPLKRSIPDIADVIGTVNDDEITGSNKKNTLRGNNGDDVLDGLDGNDRLVGNAGDDDLTGGEGKDRFVFRLEERGIYQPFSKALGLDRIADFESGKDKIALNGTTFDALTRKISFDSVDSIADAKRSKALITYLESTGTLYYNQNGSKAGFGAGGAFADLANGVTLNAKDFVVAQS